MMRKFLAVIFGLVSLGVFTPLADAKSYCERMSEACIRNAVHVRELWGETEGQKVATKCGEKYWNCAATGEWSAPKPPGPSSEGGKSAGGGGSKPKQVNGQSQRTADGGVIMVTPEGKEWVWNGKYNTVATYERNGVIGEYHSVMQGDPDANWRKVNGKNMQESDPRYMAEADAALKKQGPVVVHDHRTPQPAPTPPAAGASTNGGTATQGASAGQASSTTNPGSTATNTGGSYVRDHRAGANGATVPPPVAAAGINKKPGKYAQ